MRVKHQKTADVSSNATRSHLSFKTLRTLSPGFLVKMSPRSLAETLTWCLFDTAFYATLRHYTALFAFLPCELIII